MKHTDNPEISALEKLLAKELAEVELRIKELMDEAAALRRQIGKAAANRQDLGFSTRKNSVNRILAENSILETLRTKGKPTKTWDLFKKARMTNVHLKENTFRTYLHRMKKRGAIQTAYKAGEWRLPTEKK